MFLQLSANGLVTGSVDRSRCGGVSIVYAILRLLNFAYGDYMTFGARTEVEPRQPVDESTWRDMRDGLIACCSM
jgi:hypothetical protein